VAERSKVRADRFIRIYPMAAPSSAGRSMKERETMFEYAKALLELYLPEKAEGQSLVEWALILALVSVVAIVILTTIGTNIVAVLTDVANALRRSS
jgi:Flp pilus assembly pilin Flp